MDQQTIDRFVGIPGFSVESMKWWSKREGVLEIRLGRKEPVYRCPCGQTQWVLYDSRERVVQDLPWGPWRRVWLRFRIGRVWCEGCQAVRTEVLEWVAPRHRTTERLREAIAMACRELRCLERIAEQFGVGWNLVKAIDRERLEKALEPVDFTRVRRLAIDELATRKGHTYATVIADVDAHRVLGVIESRKQEALEAFFAHVMGPEACARIRAVTIDMWAPYEAAVRRFCPQAQIVYDLFHIVQDYNLHVIDRVRIDEAKAAQTRDERKQLKSSKWILIKNREHLQDDEPARLKELLRINRRLQKVHLLGESLKVIWTFRHVRPARHWFETWCRQAMATRIEPLQRFARRLQERWHGIVSHCRHPIGTSFLEGINNVAKVIKRIAFGYRDFHYFSLKIRGAFDPRTHYQRG